MFKAFARVAARSIAIQLEEAAAAAKAKQPYVDPTPKIHQYSAASKGKGKVGGDQADERPLTQPGNGVAQAPVTQQAEAVQEEDVTKVMLPIPGSREARQENPYIHKWPEDPPATSSARLVVPPESSSSTSTPQAEPVVASGSAIQEPVVEQKDLASITPETNPAQPDEAPIEPSQLIDDVDAETVSDTVLWLRLKLQLIYAVSGTRYATAEQSPLFSSR